MNIEHMLRDECIIETYQKRSDKYGVGEWERDAVVSCAWVEQLNKVVKDDLGNDVIASARVFLNLTDNEGNEIAITEKDRLIYEDVAHRIISLAKKKDARGVVIGWEALVQSSKREGKT